MWLRRGVILLWVVLVGLLVQRNWTPAAPPDVPPGPAEAASPADEWMGVYHGDQKIGYVHLAVVSEQDGSRFEEDSLLRLTVLETTQTVRTTVRARTAADYAL